MGDRRGFLNGILGVLLALPLGGLSGRVATAAAPRPGFYLVNGWILTDRDLAAIRAHDR